MGVISAFCLQQKLQNSKSTPLSSANIVFKLKESNFYFSCHSERSEESLGDETQSSNNTLPNDSGIF